MEDMSSSELQHELNSTLVQARQRSLSLWGLIRKIQSVNSVVLKRRDEAKEELEAYISKLSESLMDFSCDVTVAIDKLLKEKQNELEDLKQGYKDDAEALVQLCTEADGLLQFGKTLRNSADRAKAARLLEELRASLSKPVTEIGMRNLFNVTIIKNFQPDEISPSIFGQLILDKTPEEIEKRGTLNEATEYQSKNLQRITSQDEGTQTVIWTDERKILQTEARTTNTIEQTSPVHLAQAAQLTPPPGFYQGASPLHVQNTQIGGLSGGIAGYNVVPVNTYVQSTGTGTLEDPVILYYGNVVGNVNQNVIGVPILAGSGSPGVIVNRSASPGIVLDGSDSQTAFPTSPQYGIQNQMSQKNCDTPSSPSISANSFIASQHNCCQSAQSAQPNHCQSAQSAQSQYMNSKEETENSCQGTVNSSLSNITDRNSVYIPPKLPKFVKDLEKQFEGSGAVAERKPLRKPFGPPPGLKRESSFVYPHSTPIRRKYSHSQNVEKESLNLQSIGQELIDSSLKPAGSKLVDGIREFEPKIGETLELNVDKSLDSKVEESFDSKVGEAFEPKTEESLEPRVGTNTFAEDFAEIQPFDKNNQITLRDYVKKTYPPTPREINRQTLKSQTQWCHRYISQMLSRQTKNTSITENIEADNDKSVIVINDDEERGKSWVTDKINNSGELLVDLTKKSDSHNQEVIDADHLCPTDHCIDDSEGISFDTLKIDTSKDDSGICVSEKKEVSSGIEKTEDQPVNIIQIVDGFERMPEVEAKSEVISESAAETITDVKTEEIPKKDDTAVLQHEVTSGGSPQSNKRVKQKHGDSRCTNNRSRTIGPLQAHWLTWHPGADSELGAKFLFKINHSFHYPIGVSSDRQGNIYVTDTGNHVVKKFNPSGEFVLEFGKDVSMKRPSAVVVSDTGDIFVKDDLCIRKFDKTGIHQLDIRKDKFKKPFGLAMTPAKYLLVLDTHYSNPSLVHISQDGETVMEFLYTPLLNSHPQTKCRFMGVSDNNVIVSDLGLSQIYITNLEGIFLKRFGCYGSDLMQFWEPSGISVDNYGNVLIADSKNNRIQMYRYDGSYTGLVLLDEPIFRPSGIHLTADNKLVVVNFLDHAIKVYKFE